MIERRWLRVSQAAVYASVGATYRGPRRLPSRTKVHELEHRRSPTPEMQHYVMGRPFSSRVNKELAGGNFWISQQSVNFVAFVTGHKKAPDLGRGRSLPFSRAFAVKDWRARLRLPAPPFRLLVGCRSKCWRCSYAR